MMSEATLRRLLQPQTCLDDDGKGYGYRPEGQGIPFAHRRPAPIVWEETNVGHPWFTHVGRTEDLIRYRAMHDAVLAMLQQLHVGTSWREAHDRRQTSCRSVEERQQEKLRLDWTTPEFYEDPNGFLLSGMIIRNMIMAGMIMPESIGYIHFFYTPGTARTAQRQQEYELADASGRDGFVRHWERDNYVPQRAAW